MPKLHTTRSIEMYHLALANCKDCSEARNSAVSAFDTTSFPTPIAASKCRPGLSRLESVPYHTLPSPPFGRTPTLTPASASRPDLRRAGSSTLLLLSPPVLDWNGPYDRGNPRRWSNLKKAYHLSIPTILSFFVCVGGSIYPPSSAAVATRFDVSAEVA